VGEKKTTGAAWARNLVRFPRLPDEKRLTQETAPFTENSNDINIF
jgi:hypothetical protein